MPTIVDSIHVLLAELDRRYVKTGKSFNIFPHYKELTIDVISRIALGQKGTRMYHNPIIHDVTKFFERSVKSFRGAL